MRKSLVVEFLVFIGLFICLQTVFNPSDEIRKINKAEILLSNNVIKVCKWTKVDLLDYVEVINNNEEVKVNIDHVEELEEGAHEVIYTVDDVKEEAELLILARDKDEDSDNYSNYEEYEAGTDYLDPSSTPIYDYMPEITIVSPDTLEINTPVSGISAEAYDFYDGVLEVVINHNIDTSKLGDYEIVFEATDHVGNKITSTKHVKVIDTMKPEVYITAPTYWINSDVTAYVSSSDLGSGINRVEYSLDGVNFNVLNSNSITVSYSTNIYVRSIDNAGNYSSVKSTSIKIDKLAPTISIEDSLDIEAGSSFECPKYTPFDSESGIKDVYVETNIDTAIVGAYTCKYTVYDNAGNTSVYEKEINVIDTTAPELEVDYIEIDIENIDSLEEQIKFKDNAQGDITVEEIDNNLSHEEGDYQITYKVTDASGNSSFQTLNVKITNLYKTS